MFIHMKTSVSFSNFIHCLFHSFSCAFSAIFTNQHNSFLFLPQLAISSMNILLLSFSILFIWSQSPFECSFPFPQVTWPLSSSVNPWLKNRCHCFHHLSPFHLLTHFWLLTTNFTLTFTSTQCCWFIVVVPQLFTNFPASKVLFSH